MFKNPHFKVASTGASAREAYMLAGCYTALVTPFNENGVDEKGLTGLDRSYLETIVRHYDGGPVGIEAIGATLQEETDTLVDVVEPFLLAEGLLQRTSSGRKATEAAYRHLGVQWSR